MICYDTVIHAVDKLLEEERIEITRLVVKLDQRERVLKKLETLREPAVGHIINLKFPPSIESDRSLDHNNRREVLKRAARLAYLEKMIEFKQEDIEYYRNRLGSAGRSGRFCTTVVNLIADSMKIVKLSAEEVEILRTMVTGYATPEKFNEFIKDAQVKLMCRTIGREATQRLKRPRQERSPIRNDERPTYK